MAPASVRVLQGEATRARILKVATDLASQHGLESLSIGELAKELTMSKSGLFAHFGSKEELQLATIEAAEEIFTGAIIIPACSASSGMARLQAFLEGYMAYLHKRVFPGGCFFSAVAAEYDGRPGRVRDRIAISMRKWRTILESEAHAAQAGGELAEGVDPVQLVFELKAFTHEANFNRELLDDEDVHYRALRGIRDRLWLAASDFGREHLLR
jgi:AcrR family transcriptional regulator